MGKNYYPQVILEECKYAIKEKKNHNYFTYDVEISSDSDEEILMRKFLKKFRQRKILVKKILVKKILMKKLNFFYTHKYHQKLPDYRRNYC